jgi:hypothetical protein
VVRIDAEPQKLNALLYGKHVEAPGVWRQSEFGQLANHRRSETPQIAFAVGKKQEVVGIA